MTDQPKIGFKRARELIRALGGMTITKQGDGEYRVSHTHEWMSAEDKEVTAYYTTDIEDAVGTAIDMRARQPLAKELVVAWLKNPTGVVH